MTHLRKIMSRNSSVVITLRLPPTATSKRQSQRLISLPFDCNGDFETCPQYFAK